MLDHESEFLRQHPEYVGKYLVFSPQTGNKIIAVEEDNEKAWQAGDSCAELRRLAETEGLPIRTYFMVTTLGAMWG